MRDAAEHSFAVGVFDGVHIGHRAILGGADTALTFSRHPLAVVDPARAPRLIVPLAERVELIRSCAVREVRVVDFTQETASMPADEFASRYFRADCGKVKIRCGENWRFGFRGEGDARWLRERGFEVEVVPYAEYGGLPVSSSRIRRSLADGDIPAVNAMLGRRYSITGGVVRGKGEGRRIGFPTLNFEVDSLLRRGVYEVEIGGRKALANYGLAPTMAEKAWRSCVLEVHLPGCESVEFGADSVKVEFLRFIRPEQKFISVEELGRQIARDIRQLGR